MNVTISARRLRWQQIRRQSVRQLGRLLLISVLLVSIILGTTMFAISLQAGRNEARPTDWVIVVARETPDPQVAAHAIAQQQRSFGPQVLIVGRNPEAFAAWLATEHNLSTQAVRVSSERSLDAQLAALPIEPSDRVVIVADPHDLLLGLKRSRDLGFTVYGAPPPGMRVQLGQLAQAALAYWYTVLALNTDAV